MGIAQSQSKPGTSAEAIVHELQKQQIEREIALHEALEKRRRAYMLARDRERFAWTAATGSILAGLLIANAFKSKNYSYFIPIPAIFSFVAYDGHACYGDKIKRISQSAEQIIIDEAESLNVFPISADDVAKRQRLLASIVAENDLL